jgi:hypothetical protein
VVPLGEIVLTGEAVTILTTAVVLTNKKRILDELCARILAAQFPWIRFDATGCAVLEGTHQAPMSHVSNDVRSGFTRRPKVNRRREFQERELWTYELILQFHRPVSLELFERDLMNDPIVLPEDLLNGLETVRMRMAEAKYEHPTEQQPSNGTKATYQLVAEVGPR